MNKIVPQNRQEMIAKMQENIDKSNQEKKELGIPTESESLRRQLNTAKITTNDFAIKTNNMLTNSSNNHISVQTLAINVGASSIIFSPGSISCNGLVINIKVAAKNIVIP